MKLRELAQYCKSIEIDCDICEHKDECQQVEFKIEEISPYGLVDLVDKNEKLN